MCYMKIKVPCIVASTYIVCSVDSQCTHMCTSWFSKTLKDKNMRFSPKNYKKFKVLMYKFS